MASTVIAAAALTLALATPAPQAEPSKACGIEIPRALRVLDCRLTAAVARGLPRSPTLRALLARIEELHGLVYVTTAYEITRRNNHRLRGGTWNAVSAAGPYRLVRVVVEQRYDDDGTALLAHELQHVIELLDSPTGVAGGEISAGIRESRKAQEVERLVTRELRASAP